MAIAKTALRVEGLDLATGAKRWQIRAVGGVARSGQRLAVAHWDGVWLVNPADGKEVRRMALHDPRSGAPGNGLMDELKPGTLLLGLPKGLLVTRRHGGALQALDGETLAGRWLHAPEKTLPGRPDRLAVGASTLLVPQLYPDREEQTTLGAWTAGERSAKPRWQTVLPGRASRRLIFVTPQHVVGVSRTLAKRSLLWRIDRKTGQLLDARPLPMPHFCFLGEGVLACKRRGSIDAHDLATLRRSWSYVPPKGRNVRSVRQADGLLVMEVGRQLLVRRMGTGAQLFSVKRRLGGHDFRVVAALGVSHGRLLVAAHLTEESPWGDRLQLLSLELSSGKIVLNQRLGRYPRPNAKVSVEEPDKPVGQLPVLLVRARGKRPDRVFSLFDKTFQVLHATTGKSLFARLVPGKTGVSTLLLHRDGDLAVFRRGQTLFTVNTAADRVEFQVSLWRTKLRLAEGHRAFLRGRRGRLELGPKRAPDPVARGVATVNREGCRVRLAEQGRWFCQSAKKLLVLDSRSGVVGAQLDRASNVFRSGDLVLTTHPSSHRSTRPGAWVGLDLATGKERWRVEAPKDKGPLPAVFPREQPSPARWSHASRKLFLVTTSDGQCIRAVDQVTGKKAFATCIGTLSEPPLPAGRFLLLTARPLGAASEGAPKPEPEQNLYALDLTTGQARLVFRPGAGQRLVLGSAGVQDGVLYCSIRPVRGAYTRNEVVAIRLFPN